MNSRSRLFYCNVCAFGIYDKTDSLLLGHLACAEWRTLRCRVENTPYHLTHNVCSFIRKSCFPPPPASPGTRWLVCFWCLVNKPKRGGPSDERVISIGANRPVQINAIVMQSPRSLINSTVKRRRHEPKGLDRMYERGGQPAKNHEHR